MVLALFFLPGAVLAAPRIAFDSETHSWGTVYQGSKLVHTFMLTNEGDEPLNITGVRTSCGCTVAEGWPDTLAPGGKGTLTATLDSSKRQGEAKTHVVVRTNDPARPAVNLALHARLIAAVDFKPGPGFSFGNVPVGKPGVAGFEARPRAGGGMKVRKIDYDRKKMEITSERMEDGAGKEVHVFRASLRKGLPAGQIREFATVEVEIDGIGELTFSMGSNGTIVGDFNLSPAMVSFGMIRDDEKVEREVSLSRKDGEVFRVRKMKSDRKNVSAEVMGPREERIVRIRLTGRLGGTDPDSPRVGGKISVHVDDPEEPVVEIPYVYARPYLGPKGGGHRH